MAVPLGFVEGTQVAVPGGARPVEQLDVGDEVLTWQDGQARPARVVEIVRSEADQVATIDLGGVDVSGCAPGTSFFDAFEDAWRAAGSLSATSELLVFRGGAIEPQPVLEVTERASVVRLVHLRLHAPADAFFADGVLARHKELTTG